MTKYVKLRELGNFYQEEPPLLPNLTVGQLPPEWIGLFDVHGEPICRLPNPMGFGRDDEW